jgi:hypothetical protein
MVSKARAVLNRDALAAIDQATVAGLEQTAMEVLREVDPPDQTPYGEGLVDRGGFISYVDGKRVGGDADGKPRQMRVRGQGIVVAVGFGFPAKFQEMGTENQPPRPFLTPVVMRVAGDEAAVAGAVRSAFGARMARRRTR